MDPFSRRRSTSSTMVAHFLTLKLLYFCLTFLTSGLMQRWHLIIAESIMGVSLWPQMNTSQCSMRSCFIACHISYSIVLSILTMCSGRLGSMEANYSSLFGSACLRAYSSLTSSSLVVNSRGGQVVFTLILCLVGH